MLLAAEPSLQPLFSFFTIHICVLCVLRSLEGQKRVLDPVGLELQMLVSSHVGAGIELILRGDVTCTF